MKKFNWRKPVIYFLLHTNKRNILLNFSEIKKIERFSCREIRNYQKEKLAAILAHAYTKVPYYNRIFKQAGLVKAGMAAADYFDRIPFLTKEIIGKEGRNLYSTDWPTRDTYENTSGGSTGEPVKFLQDRYYNDWNVATKLYFFNTLFNREIGLPEACLWGSERDTHRNSLGLKATAVNFLYNRLFLNFFNVTDDRLYEFVRMINKIRPVSLWTYVEAVDMLAQFIKDKKINISKPEFIISTAGTLYPEIRLKAEQAFSCPVFNQYGSRETGPVAIECSEKKGLHEFFWMNYVEIINSKVYITSLRNFSMPLIRYDIGDTAVESMHGNCACGRFSLKFEEIKGRESSFFKTVRGKKVHGEYFVHLFYFVGWIKKFQIVQKNYNLIICRIVPCGFRNQADMKRIELSIKLVMGDNCRVEWDFLKQIEPSKSGKYLYSICEI